MQAYKNNVRYIFFHSHHHYLTYVEWPKNALLVFDGSLSVGIWWLFHAILHPLSSTGQYLPWTVSLAVVRTPSAEKTIVPVSSRVRLDRVRPWTRPLVLTRHWLFGFTRMPSFCQIPSTSV